MKLPFLLLSILFFLNLCVQAQFQPPPPPLPIPVSNPDLWDNDNPPFPVKKPVRLYMKDGQVIEGKSIVVNLTDSSYVTINKKNIYARQTDSMVFDQEKGYVHNNKWIYPAIRGKLTLFKMITNNYTKYYSFLKKDSTIMGYNYSNLFKCVNDNPEAGHLVRSKQIGVGLTVGLLLIGSGLTIYGLPASFTKEKRLTDGKMEEYGVFKLNPCLIIGPACLIASIPIHMGTTNKAEEAISLYNFQK